MSERYKKLYHLEHRLYAAGAPVLIEAGSLLLDQPAGTMLCQLCIRNIQSRPIKAMRAAVQMLDSRGKPLGKPVEHRYQELELQREEEYGRDIAIVLPSAEASAFSARLRQVSFADGEVWTDGEADWEELPEPPTLESFCDSDAQEERFRRRFGQDCRGPLETEELWFCPCGAVNAREEARCHRCRSRRVSLLGRNPELRDEEDALSEEDSPHADGSRRVLGVWIGAAALAVLTLAAVIVLPRLKSAPKTAAADAAVTAVSAEPTDSRELLYADALALMESGNYLGAEASFLSLGDYKDSAAKAEQCREALAREETAKLQAQYDAAAALLEAGEYARAREAFLALADYEDSADQAKEAQYRKAMALYDYITTHDVRGVTASLTVEADGQSRVSIPRERALVLGSAGIEELEAAFGGDSLRLISDDGTEEGLLPIEDATAALFRSLGDYRDSAELARRLPELRDRSEEFFQLCAEGRLEEARDWLTAYDKPFDDKELWLQRLEQLIPYCGSWTLYTGDPSLLPLIENDPTPLYSIRTRVLLREDGAVLQFLLHEGDETGPELTAELDSTLFLLHTDRFHYQAAVSAGSGHLNVNKFNDTGNQGGADFAPAK